MRPVKVQTAGAENSTSKLLRITMKEQEVRHLKDRVEDLETSITVNLQLMQGIANTKPVHTGEDTETAAHFPGRVFEKLLQQKRRLEAAISLFRTRRDICEQKVICSEAVSEALTQSESQFSKTTLSRLQTLHALAQDRDRAIQHYEDSIVTLERQKFESVSSQLCLTDLSGLAMRVTRLTHAVKEHERETEVEKEQVYTRCKVRGIQALEEQLNDERKRFPREFRSASSTHAVDADFGLDLNFESYLYQGKPPLVSNPSAIVSSADMLEEVRKEGFRMMHMKSKSEDVSKYLQVAEFVRCDPTMGQLETLFLAVRMKAEEIASLRKLSSYLESQKMLLSHKLQQVRVQVAAGTSDRLSLDPSNPDEGADLNPKREP